MGDYSSDSPSVELTGKVMVVGIIVLFLVVIFILFLHLYAKWFWYRREQDATAARLPPSRRRRRRRFDFAPGHIESSTTALRHLGLELSILKSIPEVTFDPKEFEEELECPVCLCEISEGEKARFLPKCNHGFHVECIDMWFQSHTTCPLCRNPIVPQSLEIVLQSPMESNSSVNGFSTESPNYPTNVLFWGNQTQVSTLEACLEENNQNQTSSSQTHCSSSSSSYTINGPPDEMLVIDMPSEMSEEEEVKSPVTTRLRSLKRLLSRERRVAPSNSSNVDVEQAGRSPS